MAGIHQLSRSGAAGLGLPNEQYGAPGRRYLSHQDLAESPDHASCINWTITLFLYRACSTYLIGSRRPVTAQACRFGPRAFRPRAFRSRAFRSEAFQPPQPGAAPGPAPEVAAPEVAAPATDKPLGI